MKNKQELSFTDQHRKLHVRVSLELSVKLVYSPGIRLHFDHAADQRFEPAIAFGMALIAEFLPLGGNRQGLEGRVFQVGHHHIGPTMTAVAMLASRCTCEALGIPLDLAPRIDDTQQWISFPLWRPD